MNPYQLRYSLSVYIDIVAVSILIATPPLVLRDSLSAAGKFSIIYPVIILACFVLNIISINTSWGIRSFAARLGLWGTSILWVIFAVSADKNLSVLFQYVVVGIVVLFWLILMKLIITRDASVDRWYSWIEPVLKIILLVIFGVYVAIRINPGAALLVGILGMVLLFVDAELSQSEKITLGPFVFIVVLYWWGLFYIQSAGPILPTSFWITIANIASVGGAVFLAKESYLRRFALSTAWALLASLVFLLPILWLRDRSEGSLLIIGLGILTAIVMVTGIFRMVVVIEKSLAEKLFVIWQRTYQIQSAKGHDFLEKKEFKRAIPFLLDAMFAATVVVLDNYEEVAIGLLIRYAYALEEIGYRGPEIHSDRLIHEFLKSDAESKKIVLKLLIASNNQMALFSKRGLLPIVWQTLVDDNAELRILFRRVIHSIKPFPTAALLEGFIFVDSKLIQTQILKMLQEAGEESDLFRQRGCFYKLFDAFETENPRIHFLAKDIIIKTGQLASEMLTIGLDRSRRDVREFAMHRLIELDQLNAAVEHIKHNIPKLEPKIVLAIMELWTDASNLDKEISFGEEIAKLGNLYGIDVLANLLNTPTKQKAITSAWRNILEELRNQLTDIIWSNEVEDARQAAYLYLQDPSLIQNILQVMKTENFEDRCYTAHLAARIMFLLMQELPEEESEILDAKQVISFEHSEDAMTRIKVQLTASSKGKGTLRLPIPIINLTPGHAVLLLVNYETYHLDVQIQSSASPPGRLKFFAVTDNVDIPQYAREFTPEKPDISPQIEYYLFPNKLAAFEDRLTLTMTINGIGQRLMIYELFICDPYVLNGLIA